MVPSAAPVPLQCETCGYVLIGGETCNACLLGVALEEDSIALGIEDYEIHERLGRGGMGMVYKVRHLRLNRFEAMKRMSPHLQGNPEMVMRFLREAEAAGRLDHPHIVPVYVTGEDDEGPYFTMRLVEHGSLADRLNSGPLEPSEAVKLMVGIAQAVDHAHQRGVLHRDLKPGNILLLGDGEAAVSDFGLARITEGRADITVDALNIGSPAYMAPEHLQGTGSIASDVYSLGAVLFETLTGRPPFAASTAVSLFHSIETEEAPRLRHIMPKADLDLETICAHCLEKSPERRYSSAGLLAEDLQSWLKGRPISARPVTATERARKWMRRHPLLAGLSIALIAVIVAAGIGAAFSVRSIWKAREGERQALEASENARDEMARHLYVSSIRLAHGSLEEGNPGEAKTQLAFCLPAEGKPDLRGWEWRWLKAELAGNTVRNLTRPKGAYYAAGGAPDGTYALATDSKLHLHRADDTLLAEWDLPQSSTQQRALALCSGQWVAASSDEGVTVYDRQGCLARSFPCGPQDVLSISPDGSQLITCNGSDTRLYSLTDGSNVATWPMAVMNFSWSKGTPIALVQYDGKSQLVRLVETPETFYEASPSTRTTGATSPDGKWFVVALSDRLEVVELETGLVKQRIANSTPCYQVSFSQDGKRVAAGGAGANFSVFETDTWQFIGKFRTPMAGAPACFPTAPEVWTVLVMNGSLHHCRLPQQWSKSKIKNIIPEANLRHGAVINADGTWSFWERTEEIYAKDAAHYPGRPVGWLPDGKTLILISGSDTILKWTIGDKAPQPMIKLAEPVPSNWFPPHLSPDGKLFAGQLKDERLAVFTLSDGKILTRSERPTFRDPLFSPNSSRILYHAVAQMKEPVEAEIPVVMNLETLAETPFRVRITSHPAWSPDSKLVAYGNVSNLVFCDPDTGKLVRKFGDTRAHLATCQFTPDGRTIVATGIDNQCSFFRVSDAAVLFRMDFPAPIHKVKFSADGTRCLLADPLPLTFLEATSPTP